MSSSFIHYLSQPSIGEERLARFAQLWRSGWVNNRSSTAQFEREFQAYVGAATRLAWNSCTADYIWRLARSGKSARRRSDYDPASLLVPTVNTILQVGPQRSFANRLGWHLIQSALAHELQKNIRAQSFQASWSCPATG